MHLQRPHALTLRQRWTLFALLALFFLFFAAISLVNHYLFRTFGWDLGYFNMAVFDYSELRYSRYDIYWTGLDYTMGDHFEPIMVLIAPFRYLFGQYTLLLVQIGAVLFGGYGAFTFVRHRTENPWLPHIALFHYLAIFGVSSALAFDYHNNVVGAMFLPWFLHYFGQERFRNAFLFLLLLCMSKENMALWAFFIAGGVGIGSLRNRRKLFWAVGLAGFALVYFVVTMKVIIPAFQPEDFEYVHFRYSALGADFGEALRTVFTRPGHVFKLLYENHYPDQPWLDGIKPELYRMMFYAGGIALLLRPQYLIMALPIIGQKVFSDKGGAWGIHSHYSIELVPLLSIAVCHVLLDLRLRVLQNALAVLVAVSTIASNLYSFSHRLKPFGKPENIDLFSEAHWLPYPGVNLHHIHEALALIPPDVPVSASNTIVSHLTMRDQAYMFPRIENAEYIILLRDIIVYPENKEQQAERIQDLRTSGEWEVIYEQGKMIVLRRKG